MSSKKLERLLEEILAELKSVTLNLEILQVGLMGPETPDGLDRGLGSARAPANLSAPDKALKARRSLSSKTLGDLGEDIEKLPVGGGKPFEMERILRQKGDEPPQGGVF